jgi:hypothetical protein
MGPVLAVFLLVVLLFAAPGGGPIATNVAGHQALADALASSKKNYDTALAQLVACEAACPAALDNKRAAAGPPVSPAAAEDGGKR